MSDSDRRQTPRVRVDRQFDSLGALLRARVLNLSEGGAFIQTDEPLPVGVEVDVRLSVVADDIATIEGSAVVVRVVELSPKGRGMALRFTSLTEQSRQLIASLSGAPTGKHPGEPA